MRGLRHSLLASIPSLSNAATGAHRLILAQSQPVSIQGMQRRSLSTSRTLDSRRIHILGPGNLGGFVAYSLTASPDPPPVTLLLHRRALLDAWKEKNGRIRLIENGVTNASREKGIDVEMIHPVPIQEEEPIHNLIIAVKTMAAVSAISAIKRRLTPHTNMLFLYNGLGVAEEVYDTVFRNLEAEKRSSAYLLGIMHTAVNNTEPFILNVAGRGPLSVGLMPWDTTSIKSGDWSEGGYQDVTPSIHYLLDTILRVRDLNATQFSPQELFQLQLEKLTINAAINTSTALINRPNGYLLSQDIPGSVIRPLVAEIRNVFRSLPELRSIPGVEVEKRFSQERMEGMILAAAQRTKDNISSMLQDVRKSKETEIRYINGYIVRRGLELGIECPLNSMMVQLVAAIQHNGQGKR